MTTHHVRPDQHTLHGTFNRDRPPILTVQPGDTVVFETLDASWGDCGQELFGLPVPDFGLSAEEKRGHALCGPIAVAGARPGDVLEIRIGEIRPGSWGHTYGWEMPAGEPWPGPDGEDRAERYVRLGWRIDADRGVAEDTNGLGISLSIRPFMGVMGNAPAEPGAHTTRPPRRVGGNLDCRELVQGSVLLLPIAVEGVLFSVGDGHALQGDGEVSFTAIECPMERVELTFGVRTGLAIGAPQAFTPAGFLTMGFGETLDEAARMAMDGMLDHLQGEYQLGRAEALAIASLVVDLRVTQIVNGTVGVHALLPPDVLERHTSGERQ